MRALCRCRRASIKTQAVTELDSGEKEEVNALYDRRSVAETMSYIQKRSTDGPLHGRYSGV